jgi:hypothetical protein
MRWAREPIAWLLMVPLMLAGSLAGHELGYRATVPEAHAREHALAATGHGYFAYAPLALGVTVVLLVVGLVLVVLRAARGSHPTLPAGVFALLPPLAFAVQEHVERFVSHNGAIPWTTVLEPSFIAGLFFQLPFALAALLVARVLVRVAETVGRALRDSVRPAAEPLLLSFPVPEAVVLPALAAPGRGSSERGPPLRV